MTSLVNSAIILSEPCSKRRKIQNQNIASITNIQSIIKYQHDNSYKSIDMIDLPHELLSLIFDHLLPEDIVNLSSVNSSYRQEFERYIFCKIKIKWDQFAFLKLQNFKTLINKIRITNISSFDEWNVDIFDRDLVNFSNLETIEILSSNSSNWLKYRSTSQLKELILIHDSNNQNKEKPVTFNLNHLNSFSCLKNLILKEYHFNWDMSEISSIVLSDLQLINCTWGYPFCIEQFGPQITTLRMIYEDNHSFVFSERFKVFISSPVMSSLKKLELSLLEYKNHQNLSLKLSEGQLKNVTDLKLFGWKLTNYGIFEKFSTNLRTLSLGVVIDSIESEPEILLKLKQITRSCSHVKIKTKFIQST